jgi:thioredoxin-dependent peroxiredoxin
MTQARTVSMNGDPKRLSGDLVAVGSPAPDAVVVDNELGEVRLSDFIGKVLIISAVPSLDTSVCDIQTRRFNQEAAELGNDVNVLTISMDLPFAQKRWCAAAGVERVTTLSDYRSASFGLAYGLLIEDLRLLARAVMVVDREGIVRYLQLVEEVSEEPNYEKAIEATRKIL